MVVGTAFKNKGIQPLLDAVVDYLPSPLDVPETHGHQSRQRHDHHSQGFGRRAVFGAGVQDHGGPVCRAADIHPGLFRAVEVGRVGVEFAHPEKRAHWAIAQDAR